MKALGRLGTTNTEEGELPGWQHQGSREKQDHNTSLTAPHSQGPVCFAQAEFSLFNQAICHSVRMWNTSNLEEAYSRSVFKCIIRGSDQCFKLLYLYA